MAKPKKIEFEAALAQLEGLVEQMETGELSLEDSLQAFENGIKLTRECQGALDSAEQKIQMLMQQEGEDVLVEFDAPDEVEEQA
jgi:exodeoxyribonuclease VII small subunit